MKKLSNIELKHLSFPESEVLSMDLNLEDKIMKLDIDSCYVDLSEGKRYFECSLELRNWRSLKVELYEASSQKDLILNPVSADKLADICEFEFGEEYIFRGFGKLTGQWIEYSFSGGELVVNIDLP